MRRAVLLVLGVAALTACPKPGPPAGPTPTPAPGETPAPGGLALATVDELARAVFSALQAGNEDAYKDTVATPADLRDIASRYEISTPKAMNAVMNRHEASTLRALGAFDRLREYAETDGVSWTDATLVSVTFDIHTEVGVSAADVKILLDSAESQWQFQLDDCMKTARGWVITDRPIWLGAAPTD